MGRGGRATLLVACAAGLLANGAYGQPSLSRLELVLTPAARIFEFDVVAELVVDAAGETELPITLLVRSGHRTPTLRLPDGTAVPLDTSEAPLLRAVLPLPQPASDGLTRLELRWSMSIGMGFESGPEPLEVSVPVPAWPPQVADDDAFSATLEVPFTGSLLRVFPSTMTELPAARPSHRRFAVALPVPPAFLHLSFNSLRLSRPSIDQAVDVVVSVLLLVLLGLAIGFLRRTFR